jgi:aminoglycoside phosphotransferase (APT) family kinase protein
MPEKKVEKGRQNLDLEDLAEKLGDWLNSRLAIRDAVFWALEVPSHGGMSHETILCRAKWTDGDESHLEDLVVRIEPQGPLIFPSYDLAFQCDVMQALGRHSSIPVPEIVWFESNPAVLGRPFYIMRRLFGEVPSDNPPFLLGGPLADAGNSHQATAQQNTLEALAALHNLDWRSVGLSCAERPQLGTTGLDQEFGYWRAYLDWASKGTDFPILEAAYQWCLDNRPGSPSANVFNWGDARYGNVIFDEHWNCRAILDWEMAVIGPAELDLGWFLFIHETALLWLDDLPGFVDRNGVVATYEAARGFETRDLHFYEAWAGFKAAAIRVRMIQRDFESGLCDDLAAQQRNPIIKSLRRLIDLPRV